MGWSYTLGATRKEIIRERIEGWWNDNTHTETLRHCCRGNILWILRQTVGTSGRSERWIECDILSRGTGDGWGYKALDESMGPFYYSCPLGYLSEADSGINAAWRTNVQEYHRLDRLRRSLKPGDKVILDGCRIPCMVVESPSRPSRPSQRPSTGIYEGARYRLPRAQFIQSVVRKGEA